MFNKKNKVANNKMKVNKDKATVNNVMLGETTCALMQPLFFWSRQITVFSNELYLSTSSNIQIVGSCARNMIKRLGSNFKTTLKIRIASIEAMELHFPGHPNTRLKNIKSILTVSSEIISGMGATANLANCIQSQNVDEKKDADPATLSLFDRISRNALIISDLSTATTFLNSWKVLPLKSAIGLVTSNPNAYTAILSTVKTVGKHSLLASLSISIAQLASETYKEKGISNKKFDLLNKVATVGLLMIASPFTWTSVSLTLIANGAGIAKSAYTNYHLIAKERQVTLRDVPRIAVSSLF